MDVSEGKEMGKGAKRGFEEIFVGNFTSLLKSLIYTFKKLTKPTQRYTPRHITTKLSKAKD